MLNDHLECTTFGVYDGNVQETLESRLAMLEKATATIEQSTTSEAVNEKPLAALNLSTVDLWKGYIPLATLLRRKWLEHRDDPNKPGAFCIGINAGPGSGKSTLVQVLVTLLQASEEGKLRVVQ